MSSLRGQERQRKTCTKCGKRPEHVTSGGIKCSWCAPCRNAANAETKAKQPMKYWRQRRASHLRNTFGLTIEEYDAMLEAQDGTCAICRCAPRNGKAHAVDHDAISGRIRGILCENCNRAIGQLGHDPVRIRAAAEYLELASLMVVSA